MSLDDLREDNVEEWLREYSSDNLLPLMYRQNKRWTQAVLCFQRRQILRAIGHMIAAQTLRYRAELLCWRNKRDNPQGRRDPPV